MAKSMFNPRGFGSDDSNLSDQESTPLTLEERVSILEQRQQNFEDAVRSTVHGIPFPGQRSQDDID